MTTTSTPRPRQRWTLRAVLALAATLALLTPALVSAPVAQAGICRQLGYGASCRIDFANPGNSGKGGGGGRNIPLCNLGKDTNYAEVACANDSGHWSNEWQCYVLPLDPQPTKDDPVWGDDIAGGRAIYSCMGKNEDGEWRPRENVSWKGRPPTETGNVQGGQGQIEDVLGMQFDAFYIGMAPQSRAGSGLSNGRTMGIVGENVWMWFVETPNTPWFKETEAGDEDGYWLRARATHTTWDMGDGSAIKTCTKEQMVAFEPHLKDEKPQCGHTYTKPGFYNVNMWTHFRVTWNDSNGHGGEYISIRRNLTVAIGEAQVVNE